MDTSKDSTFEISINNLGLTMQLLPKRMVVVYFVAALAAIVDLPYEQVRGTSQKDSNLACPISTKDVAHYKPTEDRELQMTRHKIVE